MGLEKINQNHFPVDDDPYKMPESGVILERVDDGSVKGSFRVRRWVYFPGHFLPPQNGSQIKKQF